MPNASKMNTCASFGYSTFLSANGNEQFFILFPLLWRIIS
ncbi:hypothetical protein EU95_1956 [Prochlorococcus marinus str. MIT 9201]|uniref:Uncharacterized protein n=1 Tax=Prochlorococcus marinus str. MIT 9201 TaxID=93057 RepID=A0A0A2A2W3_PROMR|nr:hypothetical protein EU95_1956 [Prochlorococcus marinus str. MIT 9201]